MGLANFGVEGLSLPFYKQDGHEQRAGAFPYLEAILLFSFFIFIWELFLDCRQYGCLKIKTTPPELTAIVKELDEASSGGDGGKESGGLLARLTAKFDAARAYSTDKMRLGFAESVFGEIEGCLLLLLGMMCVLL